MKGIIAYSRPRGPIGRYIFTVMLNYTDGLTENVQIAVTRKDTVTKRETVYSCHHCGRWGRVTITRTTTENVSINPQGHATQGHLEFYRYDNVEPHDYIELTIRDPELIFYQKTYLTVTQESQGLRIRNQCYPVRDALRGALYGSTIPEILYDFTLINWDQHCYQRQKQNRSIHVEEELIQQTMNAEPITIKELLLQPAQQPPALEDGKNFIEGQLRYL